MVRIYSFSEVGGHLNNEDAFLTEQHPSNPDIWIVVLADGQGGQRGGARSATLACRSAMDLALALKPSELLKLGAWPKVLMQVNALVAADPDAGYTTLIGFCLIGDNLIGASSGDSAVMICSEGVKIQELTSSQRKNPPVGSSGAVFVPFACQLIRPWQILVMSDGVWKYVGWEAIRDLVAREKGQSMLEALQGLARLPGSGRFQDDFTLVLMECEPESEK